MVPTNKQIRNAFKNKPIKSSAATNIMYKCQHILDDYGADYRGGHIENINGTNYIVFKYYGGLNDTNERNDDSWDEIYDLEGVADVGYGEGYGDNMEGTNYHHNTDCLVIQLDDSIQSARKPVKSAMQFGEIINNESNMFVRIVYTDIDEFKPYSDEETDEPLSLSEFKQMCADYAETTNGNFTVSHDNGYQPAEYNVSFATWDQFVDETNPDYNPYDEESLGSVKFELLLDAGDELCEWFDNR